jgi:hypothetical protein
MRIDTSLVVNLSRELKVGVLRRNAKNGILEANLEGG